MDALTALKAERSVIAKKLKHLEGAIKFLVDGGWASSGKTAATKSGRTKPVYSAAARRKMSLAAKKRWAAVKAKSKAA